MAQSRHSLENVYVQKSVCPTVRFSFIKNCQIKSKNSFQTATEMWTNTNLLLIFYVRKIGKTTTKKAVKVYWHIASDLFQSLKYSSCFLKGSFDFRFI
ncbi:MAG: hypothetical protein ACI87I_002323 [Pseudoalteromonas tetraodonis]|jgi:hypothetical protein